MAAYKYKMSDEEWDRKRTFLFLLLKHKGPEFWPYGQLYQWNNAQLLEDAYRNMHDGQDSVRDLYQYIFRRINSMFHLKNMMSMMNWRHKAIYDVLY